MASTKETTPDQKMARIVLALWIPHLEHTYDSDLNKSLPEYLRALPEVGPKILADLFAVLRSGRDSSRRASFESAATFRFLRDTVEGALLYRASESKDMAIYVGELERGIQEDFPELAKRLKTLQADETFGWKQQRRSIRAETVSVGALDPDGPKTKQPRPGRAK